jgi:hypothetical protein
MNPQMPPLPPSEPLDEEERTLARALRELPSAMPPPELDARILGASRRAIAIAPKPRAHRRGWVWGLSTAAAAVLAAGIMLKMHLQGRDQPIASPSEAPATVQTVAGAPAAMPAAGNAENANATTAAAADAGLAESAAVDTESKQAEARTQSAVAANTPPPLPAVVKSERDEIKAAKAAAPPASATPVFASGTVAPLDKSATAQAAANAVPQPFPAAPATAQRATSAVPPEREAAGGFAKTAAADQPSNFAAPPPPPLPPVTPAISQPRPAPVPSAPEPAQMQESQKASNERKDATLDRAEVTGSRLKASDSKQLPAVSDDVTLPPAQWLERIRTRVKAADSDGARDSLSRFTARYPDWAVPADLAPLRK